jgi:multicomponent Na+:H+ antiporter subunit F
MPPAGGLSVFTNDTNDTCFPDEAIMLDMVYDVALMWAALLMMVLLGFLMYSRPFLIRILALDVLSMVMITFLVLYALQHHAAYYLDVALALALLSFIGTLGAAGYHRHRGPT